MCLWSTGLRRSSSFDSASPYLGIYARAARSRCAHGQNRAILHIRRVSDLTHVNAAGQAHMVSVADKTETHRMATARGTVHTTREAIHLVLANGVKKGDVLASARIAGIMAAKRTSDLIPLCHNITLSRVAVNLQVDEAEQVIDIEAKAECKGQTGVEMEALVACSTAALTIYDMLKAVDKKMVIANVRIVQKSGGRSGDWKTD